MQRVYGIALWLALIVPAGGSQALAQVKVVENESPLTPQQTAVLPLLEQLQEAILSDDKSVFLALIGSTPALESLKERLADSATLYSCIIFNTTCVRSILKGEGERRTRLKQNPQQAAALLRTGQVFVSVRDFLEKHKGEMEVTFQNVPGPQIQAELHIPRRPDSADVLPPFGEYESLTVEFLRSDGAWKIVKLFPEPYQIVLSLM